MNDLRNCSAYARSISALRVMVAPTLFILCSCTYVSERWPDDEAKFGQDADLMVNVCRKFANEQDGKKLHEVAMATQQIRLIPCSDYFGECNLYGKCLSLAVQVSKSGVVESSDRSQLQSLSRELQQNVEQGKKKVREHKSNDDKKNGK